MPTARKLGKNSNNSRVIDQVEKLVDLEWQIGPLIRRLNMVHSAIFTNVMGSEVTPPQFAVLTVVAGTPGIDQSAVLVRAHLDRSTGADVIARLVRRGLLIQKVGPDDLRRRILWLSTDGEALLQELMVDAEGVGQSLLESLSDKERTQLMNLIRRILDDWEVGNLSGP